MFARKLLTDSTFYLGSDLCSAAVSTANLDKWLDYEENFHQALAFSAKLVTSLKTCFHGHGKMRVRREKCGEVFAY